MKFTKHPFSILAILFSLFSVSALATDIFKADRLFERQEYIQARTAYLAAAEIGSPHAYYQLGTIYLRGLDTQQDAMKALIWFSLAAEYQFSDAENVVKEVLALLTEEQRNHFTQIIAEFKAQFGKEQINQKYFPIINTANLVDKITFGGEGKLENAYQDPDLLLGSFDDDSFYEEDFSSFDFQNDFDDDTGFDTANNFESALARPAPVDLRRRPPFLILDYDVGSDGSIRNIAQVQTIGYANRTIEVFERNPHPQPTFKGKRVDFVNRTYLGTAIYSKFQMRDEYQRLYLKIKRLAKKLKVSSEREDQYQYAMALTSFQWLDQEEGEAEKILQNLAQTGHPSAQYEYGLMLYREQKDIPTAIHWISEASKYGLARAEYLLGRLLHVSPWVVTDEKKALFWYESAKNKGHGAATLKSAELKLLATDITLHDLEGAIENLQSLHEEQSDNPEYNFLLAISHKNRENRNFRDVVKYMERAIDLGDGLNWDVSYWESLLDAWTTGSVYIVD